ncbi:hypothetical protein HK14_15615 [Acetobacter cibinongensis]|uniref:GIY-YIG domain-containing protein n=1 Tax=Acetobacter cibinongensis TaxID=146475 RepID=A0A1Z5YR94_9PROT|nr:hypothetical protein HK14_15615 [Acetobacter cibinongensis]
MEFLNPTNANHFGVNIRKKDGLLMTRENYCTINNKSSIRKGKIYSDEWCKKHFLNCMENFDLNIKHFSKLNHEEFNNSILDFLEKNKNFQEVKNLNDYSNKSGYYIIALDKYKQVYAGTTNDIKKRIMTHWSKTKEFDRLLLPVGNVNSSILSIDSFRALDTSRIYAYPCDEIFSYEDRYINFFPPQFRSNRIGGGLMPDGPAGFIQAVATMKMRDLT